MEGPEIQIMAEKLSEYLVDGILHSVESLHPYQKRFQEKDFIFKPMKVVRVYSYGKNLIFQGDDDLHVLWNCSMNGHFKLHDDPRKTAILEIRVGQFATKLFYVDWRKWGWFIQTDTHGLNTFLQKFGPDWRTITPDMFQCIAFAHSRTSIKSLLLDQTAIAGIGNAYTEESLFRAGINPEDVCGSLEASVLRRLWENVRKITAQAYDLKGFSLEVPVFDNEWGQAKQLFTLYGRKRGERFCPDCKSPIEVRPVAGRTSYICPLCQLPVHAVNRLSGVNE